MALDSKPQLNENIEDNPDMAVVAHEAVYYERDRLKGTKEEVIVKEDIMDAMIKLARRSKIPTTHPELRTLLDRPVDKIRYGTTLN